MLEKEKSKLMLGKYKIKEGILNITVFKKYNVLKLYKNFLDDNIKNLKRINATNTRRNIELSLKHKSSYPAFDWQTKLVALNNIFGMMLGIIDARNDDYESNIKFCMDNNLSDTIIKIQNQQKSLIEVRKKIIDDYREIAENKDLKVINECIESEILYKKFDLLFKDMQENQYTNSIQGELISAYMFGYNKSLFIFPDDIMPYYNVIISEYKLDVEKNNCDYQKVNSLVKK